MSTRFLARGPRIDAEPRWPRRVAQVGGVVFLAGAALNLTLTAAAPGAFADLGPWMGGPEPLQRVWAATMGEHPRVWAPIVGVGFELAVGVLALSGVRLRRLAGLVGIGAFHLGLLAMGLWSWAVPVLVVVVPAIVLTARRPQRGE